MAYQSFEDLDVWQRGCRLAVAIFQIFENCKIFTLRDQINFSKGSCGELRTQLYIARKLKLLPKSDFEKLVPETKEISAMLEGLRRSILAKNRPKQMPARRNPIKLKA